MSWLAMLAISTRSAVDTDEDWATRSTVAVATPCTRRFAVKAWLISTMPKNIMKRTGMIMAASMATEPR